MFYVPALSSTVSIRTSDYCVDVIIVCLSIIIIALFISFYRKQPVSVGKTRYSRLNLKLAQYE